MPHVALVPFVGFRVREQAMLELGMTLPGLRQRAAAIARLPALGLLTLAGLTPGSWTSSYHEVDRADPSSIEEVVQTRPTLVALSALTASVDEAYAYSACLRARGLRVVLGGLHATACPEEARAYCDAVVVGEGEPVWHVLLRDAEADRLKPVYRATSSFDLGQSPLPRYDLLAARSRPRYTIQTQRGCPMACEFCGASRLLGSFREKPVTNLVRELAALKSLGIGSSIELADDNTFAGSREPGPLFDAFAAAGIRYFTEADWRIGERSEVLAGLARSGCVQVLLGIESLVFRYPGMGPKQAELARMMDAASAIQDAGVVVNGCAIVGGEGETQASLDRLARFLLDSSLAEVQITVQTPFPGTALHRRLRREGRLLPGRGWPYFTLFDVTYQPDVLSVAELETGFRELVRQVFSASAVARRALIRRQILQRRRGGLTCVFEP